MEAPDDHQVTAGHKAGSQEDNLVTAPPDVVKGLRDRSATPMTSSSSEDGGKSAVGKVNNSCYWMKDDTVRGLPFRTSAKNLVLFTPPPPPFCKFTQPPFLRLLTMSAFEGTPPPCGRRKWKLPK